MSKIYGKRNKNSSVSRSFWSDSTRVLFESIREIPWVGLAVASTLIGGSILFFYFRSIGYFPTDLSALAGLGSVIALAALGLYLGLTSVLFATAAIYQLHIAEESIEQKKSNRYFQVYEFLGLQLGGMGGVCLLTAYGIFRDCDRVDLGYLVVGLCLSIPGLLALLRVVWSAEGGGQRIWRSWMSILIATLALLPFSILFSFGKQLGFLGIDGGWFALGGWIFLVLANAWLANRFRWQGVLVTALFITMMLVFLVTMIAPQRSVFPTAVAGVLGVRSEGDKNLLVTREVCEILREAIAKGSKASRMDCLDTPWIAVRAQILSNIGDRWLVEINGEGPETGVLDRLRVTIPSSGVQIANSVPETQDLWRIRFCAKGQ